MKVIRNNNKKKSKTNTYSFPNTKENNKGKKKMNKK
jgi:hypothetical protein